ncbi:MAG: hypothetical protein AABY22_24795 [Nanoarchaeota archaeon]
MQQTRKVLVGHTSWDNEPVMFPVRYYGNTLILARARYGKTTIAKIIACAVSEFRPLIIIAPYFDTDDWYGLKYLNRNAEYKKCIPFLKCINNFSIKLSRFKDYSDWVSLGFPDVASQLITQFAKIKKLHNDDPEIFAEFLVKLPKTDKELENFNITFAKYNINLPSRIADATHQSINLRFNLVKHLFWFPKDERHSVDDFGKIVALNPHVLIDLEEDNEYKSRAYVGIILKDIKEYLKQLQPLLIIDEADKVAPDVRDLIYYPSSLNEIMEYKNKYQRLGVNMILCTQDPGLLFHDLKINPDFIITGQIETQMPGLSRELLDKIYYDPDKNIRNFMLLNENRSYTIFKPLKCPCMLRSLKEVWDGKL